MSAVLTDYKNTLEVASFTISTASDVASLPTTTESGKNELATIAPIKGGDAICIATGDAYILDPDDDTWKIL